MATAPPTYAAAARKLPSRSGFGSGSGSGSSSKTGPPMTFLDLPSETQREIISHCSQSDLICVALVSRHFHELASEQLYRNFHIIFPDDDDIHFDSPIDGLAGGLDTMTTSDYNYAKHLKDIFMDSLSAGVKGESSYQPYLYNTSCGKFLNNLLYLTIKKARSLESFRWNIRVELSRPVYRELHRIPSLKTLHIRMQAGESYYVPPPPLPVSNNSTDVVPTPVSHWPDPPPLNVGFISMMGSPTPMGPTPPPITGPAPTLGLPSKSLPRSRANKRGPVAKDPSTLSGFKKLRSLAILDIDDLDIIAELSTCVQNSSSTLTELQLSFSDSLAAQARKPSSDADPEESDVDDEFQVIPLQQPPNYNATAPAKAFRAQEERKVQEAALGRIFDVEPDPPKSKEPPVAAGGSGSRDGKDSKDDQTQALEDSRATFLESLKSISTMLMALSNGSRRFSAAQQEILDTIEKAARKYVEATDSPSQADAEKSSAAKEKDQRTMTGNNGQTEPGAALADGVPPSWTSFSASQAHEAESKTIGESGTRKVSLRDKTSRGSSCDACPDDIDIAHVETAEDAMDDSEDQPVEGKGKTVGRIQMDQTAPDDDDLAEPVASTPPSKTSPRSSAQENDTSQASTTSLSFHGLRTKLSQFWEVAEALAVLIERLRAQGQNVEAAKVQAAEAQLHALNRHMTDIQGQMKLVEQEIEETERRAAAQANPAGAAQRSMKQYIRDTRGLSLETLSIHLIPVKPSVLAKAINFSCLRQLTLLNVGNQIPIWCMLIKENKARPMAIRSLFTDNVSHQFLSFVSQLEEVHELFLLERGAKHKPESFAPRTTTTIDQIRRLVLQRHLGTLKRLMIKDESTGPNWDVNEKTMILICTRGAKLEELGVSMNIHAVHAFMQFFSGLVNLRAINILHFRNNDTCIWVVREILRFIVDNLSHHPELKLEWIAMEDERVDRVVRSAEAEMKSSADGLPKSSRKKNKGKGGVKIKGFTPVFSPMYHQQYPVLTSENLESESESEDEAVDSGTRLRFSTVGPLQFYDVWGVKIFEKEIRSGRL